jgi:hypothetical protein
MMSHRTRIGMLGAITVAAGIAVAILPRVAQPQGRRTITILRINEPSSRFLTVLT